MRLTNKITHKIKWRLGVETDENHSAAAIGSLLSRKLPIKLTITVTVDSGQWTVDSGQWTVDSELVEPAKSGISRFRTWTFNS